MNLLDIQIAINRLQEKKRQFMKDKMKGRSQKYIAKEADINLTRFNHWLNGTFEFDEDEIKRVNEVLNS